VCLYFFAPAACLSVLLLRNAVSLPVLLLLLVWFQFQDEGDKYFINDCCDVLHCLPHTHC
jgi:hypothetical protein